MEKLCPTACVYENVKTASERTRDDDGTLHRPAVEANLRKITPNKYDRGERERGREGGRGRDKGREGGYFHVMLRNLFAWPMAGALPNPEVIEEHARDAGYQWVSWLYHCSCDTVHHIVIKLYNVYIYIYKYMCI